MSIDYARIQVHKNAEFKKDTLHKFPVASINWLDSSSCDYWIDADQAPQLHECLTIGHVIRKDSLSITIAATYAKGKTEDIILCNVMTIPMAAVIEMTQFVRE